MAHSNPPGPLPEYTRCVAILKSLLNSATSKRQFQEIKDTLQQLEKLNFVSVPHLDVELTSTNKTYNNILRCILLDITYAEKEIWRNKHPILHYQEDRKTLRFPPFSKLKRNIC